MTIKNMYLSKTFCRYMNKIKIFKEYPYGSKFEP